MESDEVETSYSATDGDDKLGYGKNFNRNEFDQILPGIEEAITKSISVEEPTHKTYESLEM